jgi:hypothetical protein
MKRTRFSTFALSAAAALALAMTTPAVGTAPDSGGSGGTASSVPSFAEFESSTYQDLDGQYIVNGDEALASRQQLRRYYDRMVNRPVKGGPQSLVVNTVGGADDTWDASEVASLTYCVSTRFGSRQADVIAAMSQGASLWENASSAVDFTYVSSANSRCRTSNNSVVFSVEPTNSTQYIARAFFPSNVDSQRNILVNAASLVSSGWPPANILGHELGHTLGFRHEHTRPESGTCFEDNNWRPLTPYDSSSIMHYPQCNGTSSDLSFTASDGAGVRSIYGG